MCHQPQDWSADADATVYGGFSLGVMPAQRLAQQRPGARAALLYHGAVPVFTDSTTDDYDATATDLVISRTLTFLDSLD